MEKSKRRKSPKRAIPSTKITVIIPVELDTAVYDLAAKEGIGISEMYTRLLREALAARPPQAPPHA